jgi:hypothetical protein
MSDEAFWKTVAMLALHRELSMGDSGIERFDEEYDAQELREHEIALVENAYRDWAWKERGQLIYQSWG